MKISIITPSFNQADYLEETIQSVLAQGYAELEYLIIDGGSTDGSRAILARYRDQVAGCVEEPDRGQVEAINKGLARTTGEIVAFLNSDDLYLPGALAAVADWFREHPEGEWLCGETIFFGKGHPTTLYRPRLPASAAHALAWEAHCPQPAIFWRRRLLGEGFREDYRYCFDHEWMVRLMLRGVKGASLPLPLAAYRLHERSKTVAESARFDEEFARLATEYLPRLGWAEQRWVRATLGYRQALQEAEQGAMKLAWSILGGALLTYPEGILRRPWWGTLRRLVRQPRATRPMA
jgi:glycosyltransferase involved in cell wall biosynthesis